MRIPERPSEIKTEGRFFGMRNKKLIFLLIFIIILITPLFLIYKTHAAVKRNLAWKVLEKRIKKEICSFRGEVGVVIKDLNNGKQILYEQNKFFPSASLVKIPIMASCLYALEEGKINLKEKLFLMHEYKVSGSGQLKNMAEGCMLTVEELIELMITESDNTATNMLIGRLGFDYLNNTFKKLGLKGTNLSRKMMDFSNRRNGVENYTTAADIAYLLEKIYHQELLSADISKKCLELLKLQKLRDRIPAKLPPDTLVAHKTGLERGICHDGGIVFTDHGDFLICVLVKHKNKTARQAKKFIAQLAFLTYNYYQDEPR